MGQNFAIALGAIDATILLALFSYVLKISTDTAALKRDMAVFWKIMEPHLGNIIHSPHTPDEDELIERFFYKSGSALSKEEAIRLARYLHQAACANHAEGKSLAFGMALARLEMVTGITREEVVEDDKCIENDN
jgi:hypothetical protein